MCEENLTVLGVEEIPTTRGERRRELITNVAVVIGSVFKGLGCMQCTSGFPWQISLGF